MEAIMSKIFAGIDIGTTSVKAAAFDENGKKLTQTVIDYTLDTDAETGFIEFDALRYIEMCKEAISRLKSDVGEIYALSVDTQGETLILTDENGTPLCPAVVWLDNRAKAEADEIQQVFGNKRVYEVTGQPEITAGWPASKLLWFRHNRQEIFKKIKKIFMLEDYILFSLSGRFVTEPTVQSSTVYYDITEKTWWHEMLDFIGIDSSLLPECIKSAEYIGEYDGIKIVTGALDQIAGAIGSGITDKKHISEMTGTVMAICVMCDTIPPYRENCMIPCHIHAIDGKYCLLLWSPTAGMALKWFRNEFAADMSFKELDTLAERIPAGSDGLTVLPYFCGSTMPEYDPDATATFTGITLSHTRAHFARAILESVAFMLKNGLDHVDADKNAEIRITGGGASSSLWAQIKADVTQKELCTLTESETACLGCAIMASFGTGCAESISDAAEKFVSVQKRFSPSGTDYTEAYKRFTLLRKNRVKYKIDN